MRRNLGTRRAATRLIALQVGAPNRVRGAAVAAAAAAGGAVAQRAQGARLKGAIGGARDLNCRNPSGR